MNELEILSNFCLSLFLVFLVVKMNEETLKEKEEEGKTLTE